MLVTHWYKTLKENSKLFCLPTRLVRINVSVTVVPHYHSLISTKKRKRSEPPGDDEPRASLRFESRVYELDALKGNALQRPSLERMLK